MKLNTDHPFQIPENFFEDFKKEMTITLASQDTNKIKHRRISLAILKYAAIVLGSFFLGRASTYLFTKPMVAASLNAYSVDEILSQVSDENIMDFFMENGTREMMEN